MVISLPLFLERMSDLLPAEKKQVLLNTLPRREAFKILYHLNRDNLCGDFRQDLKFRFSWNLLSPFLPHNLRQVSMLYIIVLQAMVLFN
jgi:hypothetical protein